MVKTLSWNWISASKAQQFLMFYVFSLQTALQKGADVINWTCLAVTFASVVQADTPCFQILNFLHNLYKLNPCFVKEGLNFHITLNSWMQDYQFKMWLECKAMKQTNK